MTDLMSAITRATGIVATVLAVAAVLWGLLFSARATGERRRPNWWLDLHNWLGGLTLIFTGVHLVTVWLQSTSGIGLVQVFIPGTAAVGSWGVTWGVIATYLFAVAVFTTWPRRLRKRKAWRMLHLGSVVGAALAMVHAYQSGSDATASASLGGLAVLGGFITYGIVIRLIGLTTISQTHS